jgi:hypothetical protein
MGGTAWSDDHYASKANLRASTNTPTFATSKAIDALPDKDKKAHDSLNPLGVKVRESRDSDLHPESLAIAVINDVTGSMLEVPKTIQKQLCKLMGLLWRKGYVAHPQILVGAVGDANSDFVPLQMGQFESGIEIENDLTNLYLEGNGGGQNKETYELGMYFLARHTSLDCFEKRGKRGYCFIIGDEGYYPKVKKDQVKQIIGDTLEADIPTAEIVKELQKTFEVYYIMPNLTSHYGDDVILSMWKELLGENVLTLDDPDAICEMIASTIGVCEGIELSQISEDLKEAGTTALTVASIGSSLSKVKFGRKEIGPLTELPDDDASTGVSTF